MSPATVLARAQIASTRNHLTAQFGGPQRRNVIIVVGVLLTLGYNVFVYFASAGLLGGLVSDSSAARTVLPLLPIVLTMPSFGIALLFTMLLPVESPLALQARLLGASRWYCAASEFVPAAVCVAIVSVLGLAGSFVFVAGLSAVPTATFAAFAVLCVIFGMSCLVVTLAIERLLGMLRASPRERRLWGILVAAGTMIVLCVDVINWAAHRGAPSSPSLISVVSQLWQGRLPGDWVTVGCLTVIAVVLFMAGCALSLADPAGGYLRAGSVAFQLPRFRSFPSQLIASEVASWIREPTSRVSLSAMCVIDVALIAAARAQAADPGVILLLLVLVSATGGELVVGRSRDVNWILRALGMREAAILWLRFGVVFVALTMVFTAALAAGGLLANPPIRIAEAYSLFVAVSSVGMLAGTIIPFDERAPLGMFATSAVSILLEIVVITAVTTVLRLEGIALVGADLLIGALCGILISVFFRRIRLSGA